ncbi:hypothetical protein RHMOL_Rhmol09G0044800 [Rhododendron molle]|uniref:Uncharacterized protein n=1 Tax=Rhododendron molle TaxID=49168 RepID=A0ACC0MAU1_RHOML|nr:hypothetical protein RHMOL_Rhmol09G0044800 [Rhododendron molle]
MPSILFDKDNLPIQGDSWARDPCSGVAPQQWVACGFHAQGNVSHDYGVTCQARVRQSNINPAKDGHTCSLPIGRSTGHTVASIDHSCT